MCYAPTTLDTGLRTSVEVTGAETPGTTCSER